MTFDRFVGLPWGERGRGPDRFDCWGLYRHMLAAHGISVPSFDEGYAGPGDPAIDRLVTAHRGTWAPVPAGQEQPLDGALFFEAPWHIGIVAGGGRMLHMPRSQTSVIETYTSGRWARRLEGFYRFHT